MARLVVTLLGGFGARLEPGGPLSLPTRKSQALLAYLALPPGQPHLREKLAALLWGGIREESARASLRQALFALRRALPATPALRIEGDTVAVDPTATRIDVAAFETAVRAATTASLEEAAALYTGDLLAGLVVDEPPFEEWLLGERERLRELAIEGLAKLLAHQRTNGLLEAAVATALRLLTLDPLQEPVHRALMRLYADLGRRTAALRQYQQCVMALRRELGVEPEAETQQLYQTVLRARGRPSVPGGPAPRDSRQTSAFVGRAAESRAVADALERSAAGAGHVLAVVGEAGIGKTRLIEECVAEGARLEVRVLAGRAYESEQILPFAAWVDALRGVDPRGDAEVFERLGAARRTELSRLIPGLAAPTALPVDVAAHGRLFEAVAVLLDTLSMARPLLLVLEDLHWGDELSVRLLAFVGRRIGRARVLVIASARAEELDESASLTAALDELARDKRVTTLPLESLPRADTDALVQALARTGTDAVTLARLTDAVWRLSEGNPFVVVETVQAATEGAPLGDGLSLPERVRGLISRRVERLSEPARAMAAVAAIAGRELEFGVLARAAGLPDEAAATALEELVRRRVLHETGDGFEFTHDRIRTAVYASLLPPRRTVLHRRVAEALEASPPDTGEAQAPAIARHAFEGELWEKAVEYLRRAAALAVTRAAYRQAADYLDQALLAHARLPAAPGRAQEAIDLHLEARHILWPLDANDRILEHVRQAQALAEGLGDPLRLARIATYRLQLLRQTGDTEAALAAGRHALRLADACGERPLQVAARFFFGQTLMAHGSYDEAEATLRLNEAVLRGEPARQRYGLPGYPAAFMLVALALCAAQRGAFREALELGAEAVALADSLAQPFTMAATHPFAAMPSLLRGDAAGAIELLERTRALCRSADLGFYGQQADASLGYARHLMGRSAEALAPLEAAIADVSGATLTQQPIRLMWLGEAYLELGRVQDARAMARRAREVAERHRYLGMLAWAYRLLAEIAVAETPLDRAASEEHLARALDLAEPRRMRPLVAHCHRVRGRLLAAAGERALARGEIAAALAGYRAMEMPYWIARAERDLASLG
jgi:DNA-binding SARP family transcriptional activator